MNSRARWRRFWKIVGITLAVIILTCSAIIAWFYLEWRIRTELDYRKIRSTVTAQIATIDPAETNADSTLCYGGEEGYYGCRYVQYHISSGDCIRILQHFDAATADASCKPMETRTEFEGNTYQYVIDIREGYTRLNVTFLAEE